MKRALLILPLLLATPLASAQSGYDLFQQALVKERAEGNAEAALALYERIGNEYASDRALAARALLQQGLLYEKLGRQVEAQQAFEAVVSQYADQTEAAKQARGKLAAPRAEKDQRALNIRQLWAGHDVDLYGSPSPDGRYITYVDWSSGDLARYDFATGDSRRLTGKGSWETADFAGKSVVSPDGRRVAYAWFNNDAGRYDLHLIGIDGSGARLLYQNPEMESVQPHAWTPDGARVLAVFTRRDRTNQIGLVSVADGSFQALKTLDWRSPVHMGFSPDGRFIAYDFPSAEDTPEHDVFILATDASLELPAIQHPAHDVLLGWTPDGTGLLFASDRTGSQGVWLTRVQDGNVEGSPVLIKPDIGSDIAPMGFVAGGTYYYGLRIGVADVFTARLDPATGKLIEPPVPVNQRFLGQKGLPTWSGDGKHLAYALWQTLSGTMRRGSIVIRALDTGEERILNPELVNLYRLDWSPDSRFFLAQAYDLKGGLVLGDFLIDAQTGAVSRVTYREPGTASPIWTPDGRGILYTLPDSTRQSTSLVRRDLETGTEQEVVKDVSLFGRRALSPDGRMLAVLQAEKTESEGRYVSLLKLLPLGGGEPRTLFRQESDGSSWIRTLEWTPDGKQVFFVYRASPERGELWRVDVESGEARKTDLEMEDLHDFSFHPDGSRVTFKGGADRWEVWAMEDFLPTAQASTASQPGR